MKKNLLKLVFLSAVLFVMTSCGGPEVTVSNLEGKWTILEVKGLKPTVESLPYMVFDVKEKTLTGFASCNMFNTSIEVDKKDASKFTIKQAAATMMACPNMTIEDAFFKGLQEVKSVKPGKVENQLLLVDDKDQTIFLLKRN